MASIPSSETGVAGRKFFNAKAGEQLYKGTWVKPDTSKYTGDQQGLYFVACDVQDIPFGVCQNDALTGEQIRIQSRGLGAIDIQLYDTAMDGDILLTITGGLVQAFAQTPLQFGTTHGLETAALVLADSDGNKLRKDGYMIVCAASYWD